MIFIGERINAGFKEVKRAVLEKDADVIRELARRQADRGANYLDVCLGTASADVDDLLWMIEQVQGEVDVPISIDNNKVGMIKEAVAVCKATPLINSTTAVDERMDLLFPIAAESGASIIGLVMDDEGSPKNADKRVENAGKLMAKAMEYDLGPEQLFIDPIVMPLKFMQDQCKEILGAAAQFRYLSEPPPHVVCGLSNVSNGATRKKLINRTFAVMMVANGMDAVILNLDDDELVNAILTADLIMDRAIYADSYVEAFHS